MLPDTSVWERSFFALHHHS